MKILLFVLTLSVAGVATQPHAPIPADEVTLRHKIYGDGRVTIFLLDIPPGQARPQCCTGTIAGRTRTIRATSSS
jgi:hypothetical protein